MSLILFLCLLLLMLVYLIWFDVKYFNGNAPLHIITLSIIGGICGMEIMNFVPVKEVKTKEKVSVTYEITLKKNNNKTVSDTTYIYTFKGDNIYAVGNINLNTDLLKH